MSVKRYQSEADLQTALNIATSVDQVGSKGMRFWADGDGLPTIPPTGGIIHIPEVVDVLAKLSGITPDEELCIAQFVSDQVDAGNWGTQAASYSDSRLDYFSHLGLQLESNTLISWRNTFTATNTGGTHIPGTGILLQGSDVYDSNYSFTSDGEFYLDNDAMAGFHAAAVGTFSAIVNTLVANNSVDLRITDDFGASRLQIRLNTTANLLVNATGFTSDTLYVACRRADTTLKLFIDGVDEQSALRAFSQLPAGNLRLTGTSSGDMTIAALVAGGCIGFDNASFFADLTVLNTCLADI